MGVVEAVVDVVGVTGLGAPGVTKGAAGTVSWN